MPRGFSRCVQSGGRVRTMTRPGGKYQRICVRKNKSYAGHIKKRATSHRKRKSEAAVKK